MRDGSKTHLRTNPARYTLGRAMFIVRQIETSATRRAVFEEIKEKNRIIRWVDRAYLAGGPLLVRRLLLCIYMLKCAGALAGKAQRDTAAIAIANFGNEVHTVDRIKALVPTVSILLVRPSIRNAVKLAQLIAMLRMIGVMPRFWFVLGQLAKRYDFMPACRVSSALAYYWRFGNMLDAGPEAMAALTASNYSPEAVGLSAAAHQRNRKVIYVNHAPVPRNSLYVPPVFADISVFYGETVRETYAQRSRCVTHPVYVGLPDAAQEMVLSEKLNRVGIFLTALTRKETIARLISEIRLAHPDAKVLIRHHPVSLLETDLSDLVEKNPGTTVTIGSPLSEDIAACDAVICGNSGVILNTLHAGRPVAYIPELDELPQDYNGFLESGLVPRLESWGVGTLATLALFYSEPGWQDVMIGYNASYGQVPDALEQQARDCLLTVLDLRPSPD